MIKEVEESILDLGFSGLRAQAVFPSGDLIMDFVIEKIKRQIHVLNSPSPGATASIAIASYIIKDFLD